MISAFDLLVPGGYKSCPEIPALGVLQWTLWPPHGVTFPQRHKSSIDLLRLFDRSDPQCHLNFRRTHTFSLRQVVSPVYANSLSLSILESRSQKPNPSLPCAGPLVQEEGDGVHLLGVRQVLCFLFPAFSLPSAPLQFIYPIPACVLYLSLPSPST